MVRWTSLRWRLALALAVLLVMAPVWRHGLEPRPAIASEPSRNMRTITRITPLDMDLPRPASTEQPASTQPPISTHPPSTDEDGDSAHPPHPASAEQPVSTQPSISTLPDHPATDPDEDGDSARSIRSRMESCSRALGVSTHRLELAAESLDRISARAAEFIATFRSVVPRDVPSPPDHAPCWVANVSLSDRSSHWLSALFPPGGAPPDPSRQTSRLLWWMERQILSSGHTPLCLPAFFLAGFPKSGTTTLYHALAHHPQLTPPTIKEPHWWGRGMSEARGWGQSEARGRGQSKARGWGQSEARRQNFGRLSILSYLTNFATTAQQWSKSPEGAGLIQGAELSEEAELTERGDESSEGAGLSYDGSQNLLWDSAFFSDGQDYCAQALVLQRLLPWARFLVVMREPASRAYSHFLWSCSLQHGSDPQLWPPAMQQDAPGLFQQKLSDDLDELRRCLRAWSLHECVSGMRRSEVRAPCGTIGFRLAIGLYHVHLSKWMQVFPRQRFLLLRTDDFEREPVRVMNRITEFLGLRPLPGEVSRHLLQCRANALQAASQAAFAMGAQSYKVLRQFYQPYNERLAELSGDQSFLWNNTVM